MVHKVFSKFKKSIDRLGYIDYDDIKEEDSSTCDVKNRIRRIKAMNRVRKNKKKGFTLVELMIVVVIMVILAAAASPIFKGYLDRAKEAGYLANCRTVYVATQTVIQDYTIAGKTDELKAANATPIRITATYDSSKAAFDSIGNDIQKLAQVSADGTEKYEITLSADGQTCEKIEYTSSSGTTVTFTPKESSLTSTTP